MAVNVNCVKIFIIFTDNPISGRLNSNETTMRDVLFNKLIWKFDCYIIGGRNTTGIPQETVYEAEVQPDGSLGPWNPGPTLPLPISTAGYTKIGDFVVIAGGYTGSSVLSNVYYAPINPDGSLEMPYEKFYGLEHIAIWLLKKVKPSKKAYEKEVVYLINGFQILIIVYTSHEWFLLFF